MGALGTDFLRILYVLDQALRREIKIEIRQHGLTPAMGMALIALRKGEGCSAAELSRRIGVPIAATGTLVAALLRRGFVLVVRDGAASRETRIHLSEDGLSAASAYEAAEAKAMRTALQDIDDAEMAAVERTLRSLLLNLGLDPKPDGR